MQRRRLFFPAVWTVVLSLVFFACAKDTGKDASSDLDEDEAKFFLMNTELKWKLVAIWQVGCLAIMEL